MVGIAVYPEKAKAERILAYVNKAHAAGFRMLFMNYLGQVVNDKRLHASFVKIAKLAKSKGWRVVIDVNPKVFTDLKLPFGTKKCFDYIDKLGATAIRLDESFGGKKESEMTRNKSVKIGLDINASDFLNIEDKLKKQNADFSKVTACHNFYPQRYTGLGIDRFTASTRKLQKMGIKVSCFITLDPKAKTLGPWDVNEGMPTVEAMRDKSVGYQSRFYAAAGLDGVYIATMFATDAQLKDVASNFNDELAISVKREIGTTKCEEKIAYRYPEHVVRGDYGDYFIRSTKPRVVFKNEDIKQRKLGAKNFKRGDVLIANEKLGRYKGEVHVVLKDFANDGKRNLIGKIPADELIFLEMIEPWKRLRLIPV